jgi:ATP-GRASP peptide maturase of grasp-with-spasm system
MVLIYSELTDRTTSEVVAWLNSFNCKIIRINNDENKYYLKRININNDEIIISDGNDEFNLLEVKSVWYRRRGISGKFLNFSINNENIKNILLERDQESCIRSNLLNEMQSLLEYIYYKLENNRITLSSYFNSYINKLYVLDVAQKVGLKIPDTCILQDKDTINDYIKSQQGVITKSIGEGIYRFAIHNAYYTYTEKIELQDLLKIDRRFFPSLFQKQIKKQFEIRTFYFNKKCYSMAIFSQNSKKTQIDFRKYDQAKPARTIPYKLPFGIEKKIEKLMKLINMNTGSIDFILDNNNEYYFLEINPIGQFGMVSYPCNYFLEKKVANFLKGV